MKKLQNNFTTPEQSKRLLELGVPANSADCYTAKNGVGIYTIGVLQEKYTSYARRTILYGVRPCWSVGRLMEILEKSLDSNAQIICDPIGIDDKISYMVDTIAYFANHSMVDFSKLED